MNLTKAQIEAVKNSLELYTDDDFEGLYRNMLREMHGEVKIAGYEYDIVDALQSVDPTAYRVGLADYSSDLLESYTEIESGLYVNTDELEAFLIEQES